MCPFHPACLLYLACARRPEYSRKKSLSQTQNSNSFISLNTSASWNLATDIQVRGRCRLRFHWGAIESEVRELFCLHCNAPLTFRWNGHLILNHFIHKVRDSLIKNIVFCFTKRSHEYQCAGILGMNCKSKLFLKGRDSLIIILQHFRCRTFPVFSARSWFPLIFKLAERE